MTEDAEEAKQNEVQEEDAGDLMGNAVDTYQNLNKKLAISKEDPIWLLLLKILGQFALVIFMILLSPFILVGLFIAFIAVL